jgi:hypothetical protein
MDKIETRGRKRITGRFETRAELCAHVWDAYRKTPARIADIARQARVSTSLVSRILDTKEGMPAARSGEFMTDAEILMLEARLPLPAGDHPGQDDGAAFRLQLRFRIFNIGIAAGQAIAGTRNHSLMVYEPLDKHPTEERALRVAILRAAVDINEGRGNRL